MCTIFYCFAAPKYKLPCETSVLKMRYADANQIHQKACPYAPIL